MRELFRNEKTEKVESLQKSLYLVKLESSIMLIEKMSIDHQSTQ
jgi:hypothetical protein